MNLAILLWSGDIRNTGEHFLINKLSVLDESYSHFHSVSDENRHKGAFKKKKNLSHQNVKKEGSQKFFDFNGSNITTVTIIALSQAMVIQFF